MFRWAGYCVRRVVDGGVACGVRGCAGQQVGYTAWCRYHTGLIVAGDQWVDLGLAAALRELGWKPPA